MRILGSSFIYDKSLANFSLIEVYSVKNQKLDNLIALAPAFKERYPYLFKYLIYQMILTQKRVAKKM
jgi:hypothetical protein